MASAWNLEEVRKRWETVIDEFRRLRPADDVAKFRTWTLLLQWRTRALGGGRRERVRARAVSALAGPRRQVVGVARAGHVTFGSSDVPRDAQFSVNRTRGASLVAQMTNG
jgi:hypothetical protein